MEVPGYTEIRELGHGGSGHVMLAVRDPDRRPVAIKHLSERLRADPAFLERFRAEATLIAELDSPHIARLLEYAESQDDAVIVMELVDGITLRQLLRYEGSTGPESALVVLKGALLGLAEAHRAGVVHRDFKPENVIVTADGGSKLVDFGVAAHFGESGPAAGTPSYMAPEQWEDAPASPATDVYAATVVFFECLTGHRPFLGENDAALAYQHQHAEPPLGNVEESVRGLVAHGLAKDPAERPDSADAFLVELEEVALAAHGPDWEERGRMGLGALTVPHTALLPMAQPVAQGTTSLAHTALTPAAKLAVTSGVIVAAAAAVVSAFVIWTDPPPEVSSAQPPPSATAPPSPSPSQSGTAEPTQPSQPISTLSEPVPSTTTTGSQPSTSAEPSASTTPEPDPTTASPEPSSSQTSQTSAPEPSSPEPSAPDPTTSAPDPTTSAPDPTTTTSAPGPAPLLSVSVSVSLGLPLLGGDGDGLIDAGIGLDIGSGLLGMAAVPGSVLLGRHLVIRRTRRPRE